MGFMFTILKDVLYNQLKIKPWTSLPSVFDLEEDGLGNIWAATNGDALWCINPQTLRVDHINQIEAEGKTLTLNRYLNDICIDKDGVFWLASYNGFFCWNLKKHTFRLFRGFFDKANDEPVYAIRQSRMGVCGWPLLPGFISIIH